MPDLYNPSSPEYQDIAERGRQRSEALRQRVTEAQAPYKAERDYYAGLRKKYSNMPSLSDADYDFLEAAQPIIENMEDPQEARDRIIASAFYANALNQPIDAAYLNLDEFHRQWTGQKFIKKSGLQAVIDSLGVSFLAQQQNALAIKYHDSGQDPEVLKELQEVNQNIEKLRDNVPKIWQDEYIKQGGIDDVLAFTRSIFTSAAENAVPIGIAIGAGALAATGVGAIAEAAALPAGLSGILVAGASGLATAEATALSTVGTEYFELVSQGIPDDIAWVNANISSQIQGAIEVVGGGVASTTTKRILKSAAPGAVEKAVSRWFIKGKMGAGSKAFLDYLQEMAGEGFEEGTQQITSIAFYNMAAAQTNKRREELLQKIYAEPLAEARKELEKELEKYPEIDQKDFEEAWKEVAQATIGGMGTALVLGIPGARIGYRNNIQAATALTDMAKESPNEAAFKENLKKAEAEGFKNPFTEGMKSEEEDALLSDIYKVQQSRMTEEDREALQTARREADALTEVTDYGRSEIQETKVFDEGGKETGEISEDLINGADSDIYYEDGRLATRTYTDAKDDGATSGAFVAGDRRINDDEKTGANRYGFINYTVSPDSGTVTVDEFKMTAGYENLREKLFDQFAAEHPGQDIVWNPARQGNLAIRERLVSANPRGPRAGLNYYEQENQVQASAEARQIAERFRPYLKNSTPLEAALAVETFGAFYRRRGESLTGAMNRLLGRITNEAPQAVNAAQAQGKTVKGATWLEQTAEGMQRVIYINKNAADSSTVVHEISHAVERDFTDSERNIAARALNGYTLKNGIMVSFEENSGPWTSEQHEAFAEALENYLTNGTAPNEEIKSLFERIKEFMKRVYQTMKGWTELSPEAERFYKSLLSGELVDEALAETSPQAREEGRSEAREGKRQKIRRTQRRPHGGPL